jgi:hypothetical protein
MFFFWFGLRSKDLSLKNICIKGLKTHLSSIKSNVGCNANLTISYAEWGQQRITLRCIWIERSALFRGGGSAPNREKYSTTTLNTRRLATLVWRCSFLYRCHRLPSSSTNHKELYCCLVKTKNSRPPSHTIKNIFCRAGHIALINWANAQKRWVISDFLSERKWV